MHRAARRRHGENKVRSLFEVCECLFFVCVFSFFLIGEARVCWGECVRLCLGECVLVCLGEREWQWVYLGGVYVLYNAVQVNFFLFMCICASVFFCSCIFVSLYERQNSDALFYVLIMSFRGLEPHLWSFCKVYFTPCSNFWSHIALKNVLNWEVYG